MELVLFRAYWTFVPWTIGLKVLSLGRHEIFSPEDEMRMRMRMRMMMMRMRMMMMLMCAWVDTCRHLKLPNAEGHEDPFAN